MWGLAEPKFVRYNLYNLAVIATSLTDKTRMPSPQTPLPERARGFENLQLFLAPLLLLWEKGLGDEGKRFVSQSGDSNC
jgi:hypothetical protein